MIPAFACPAAGTPGDLRNPRIDNVNWGNPTTNLHAGTVGRITAAGGAPRIMQVGVKSWLLIILEDRQ